MNPAAQRPLSDTRPPAIRPDARGLRRWAVVLAGVLLQACLGTVYAWSYFQGPIRETFGWSNGEVARIFSLAICCLGLAAAWAGWQLKRGRFSPRFLAVTGGVLFGLGHLVTAAALAAGNLGWLLIGYGVIGGTGLGLGYVVPVATAARWFPEKKGLVTGMVVMGFGLGALLMSKVLAPFALELFGGNLSRTFALLGGIFLVATPTAGAMMANPPGPPPRAPANEQGAEPVAWGRFLLLWMLFFANILVGIAVIGFQSPLLQDLLRHTRPGITPQALTLAGGTLIAWSALCNGVGRIVCGAVADRIGPARTFSLIFAVQAAAFLILTRTETPWFFGLLVCVILLCYGGGFGVIPSFVHSLFGESRMAMLYGIMLTAWSAAGVLGPSILAALRDRAGSATAAHTAFTLSALVMIAGCLLSFVPALKTAPNGCEKNCKY